MSAKQAPQKTNTLEEEANCSWGAASQTKMTSIPRGSPREQAGRSNNDTSKGVEMKR